MAVVVVAEVRAEVDEEVECNEIGCKEMEGGGWRMEFGVSGVKVKMEDWTWKKEGARLKRGAKRRERERGRKGERERGREEGREAM